MIDKAREERLDTDKIASVRDLATKCIENSKAYCSKKYIIKVYCLSIAKSFNTPNRESYSLTTVGRACQETERCS